MGVKELLKNNQVTVNFYAIKDAKGILFYNNQEQSIAAPEFNNAIDCFVLNPAAKFLVCISDMKIQLSDLMIDYFLEEDILDEQTIEGNKYIIVG